MNQHEPEEAFLSTTPLRYFFGLASFEMLAMFRRGLFYAYLSIYLRPAPRTFNLLTFAFFSLEYHFDGRRICAGHFKCLENLAQSKSMGYQRFDIDLTLDDRPQRSGRPESALLDGMMDQTGVDNVKTVVMPAGNIKGNVPGNPAVEDQRAIVPYR
ncbi:MAG: hypothetical protein JSW26_18865, partial [Desulfobacterales bacterium]